MKTKKKDKPIPKNQTNSTMKSLYECRSISELQQIISQYITNLEQLAKTPIVQ